MSAQDESGAADSSGLEDSSQERFIGPLPRDGSACGSGDYSSPSYSYSSILSKSDTGQVLSPVEYVIIAVTVVFNLSPHVSFFSFRLCWLG